LVPSLNTMYRLFALSAAMAGNTCTSETHSVGEHGGAAYTCLIIHVLPPLVDFAIYRMVPEVSKNTRYTLPLLSVMMLPSSPGWMPRSGVVTRLTVGKVNPPSVDLAT